MTSAPTALGWYMCQEAVIKTKGKLLPTFDVILVSGKGTS